MNIIDLDIVNKYDNIVHLADIHIPNNLEKEFYQEEYSNVLNNLDIDLKNRSNLKRRNTCIVIAGDIFDMEHGLGNKLHPNATFLISTTFNYL